MDSNELEAVKLPNELEIAKLWDLILKFIGADRNRIILLLEKSIDFMSEFPNWTENIFFSPNTSIRSKQMNQIKKLTITIAATISDFLQSPYNKQQRSA